MRVKLISMFWTQMDRLREVFPAHRAHGFLCLCVSVEICVHIFSVFLVLDEPNSIPYS